MINAPTDKHDALIAVARQQVLARGSESSSAPPHPSRSVALWNVPGYQIEPGSAGNRGGQGVVYQAVQESTGRTVAIKVMHERRAASSHDRARFEREIHILGQLDHPNIVGIIDSGEVNGHNYFVMDYVDGVPLDRY
jgi:hypothetical protein